LYAMYRLTLFCRFATSKGYLFFTQTLTVTALNVSAYEPN